MEKITYCKRQEQHTDKKLKKVVPQWHVTLVRLHRPSNMTACSLPVTNQVLSTDLPTNQGSVQRKSTGSLWLFEINKI